MKTAAKTVNRPLTSHEEFCLMNAAHFVAAGLRRATG